MATTKSLLTLPPELFERITEHAAKTDLRSLRLVCHEAATKTLRTFSRVYFSHLRVVHSDLKSLAVASSIVSHTQFGPAVAKLSIFINAAKVDGMGSTSPPPSERRPESLKDMQARIAKHQKILEDQQKHNEIAEARKASYESGAEMRNLIDLLRTLSSHGKLKSVSLTDLRAATESPIASGELNFYDIAMRYSDTVDFTFVVEAIERSGMRTVQELEMNTDTAHLSINEDLLGKLYALPNAFLPLRSFDFSIWRVSPTHHEHNVQRDF